MTRHKATRRRSYRGRGAVAEQSRRAAELHAVNAADQAHLDEQERMRDELPAIAPETELERWARDGNR